MTDEEFRADLLAAAASRAESHVTGLREAFVSEVLERLREAGEAPEAEICAEKLEGHRRRLLEIDAFSIDEADLSLHLFIATRDGGSEMPARINLSDARDQGFNRLLAVYEQARDGWLTQNIEESRPMWALARRIETSLKPSAVRLHVLTDRMVSERLREIPPQEASDGVSVTFQIWDITRLQRIHEAQSARDDLFVDLTSLPGGGLPVLPAAVGVGDYEAYLAVVPGEFLADIYLRHGSRLLEGNVRTFLGRRGNVNKGIATTLAKEPARFFAYNNGIATTATAVTTIDTPGKTRLLTGVSDLQIVNGAQTTASLASLRLEGKLPVGAVFVPMKLSVVAPEIASGLVQEISRCANSQNAIRASDFFANHPFHLRMEEISRRILAPAIGGSQVQTHWYYERARGQYLNDQATLKSSAKRDQFGRLNPRHQVITKTDLAKVESCFDQLPDVACKGAEKAFDAFADRVAAEWEDETKRSVYGDDWYRAAAARTILFRATEALVSKADWYESGGRGYRAQIVAYTTARLAALAARKSNGGRLDYHKVWAAQTAGEVLERQLAKIAEVMNQVLWSPPQAGQNISEWAKQQACRKRALETDVPMIGGFDRFLVDRMNARSDERKQREDQRVTDGLAAVSEVVTLGAGYWQKLRDFARENKIASPEEDSALGIACGVPKKIPADWQAARALDVRRRCSEAGFEGH
jgi:AIPR protein/abortive infection phage resistance-like protein